MPQTIPRDERIAEEVQRLYVPHVFGYTQVAKRLGINRSTVRRYASEDNRERDRVSSRAYKDQQRGTCVDCERPTRYNGRTTNGPSLRCPSCAAVALGQTRAGQGPVQQRILALLGEYGELRFTEICRLAQITKDATSPTLHRMRQLGIVVRPRRGVYTLPENEGASP